MFPLFIYSPPSEITDWCDEGNDVGQTAICPMCGIDSVIGDADISFDKQFLEKMYKKWF